MESALQEAGYRRRILWLAAVLAAIGLLLLTQLVRWQVLPHEEIITLGLTQSDRPHPIPAARGAILDATGHYLVASTVRYRVGVTPRLLGDKQKEELAPQLAAVLGKPVEEIKEILAQNQAEYVPLANRLPAAVGLQLEDLRLPAFKLEAFYDRVYPDDGLAASVLGFIGLEKHEAYYGLEQRYDSILRGKDGVWRGVVTLWSDPLLVSLSGYQPAEDGADLVLTLDRNVQYTAEQMLREGMAENKASAGNILVMDAQTGAILAMANAPSYRPGEYWRVDSSDQYINTAISAVYEPGSVFKPLTLAAGLEARVIRPTDTYDDRGEIIVGNQHIYNSGKRVPGRATMTELLAYSYNVGAAHVATLLGPTRFYEIIRRFGFAEVTGIDLALEVPGWMRWPGHPGWHMSDLGTNSYGQGLAVTPIQVVAAYGALANGGILMRPYIVAEIRRGDRVEKRAPQAVRRVISAETSQQITQLMADAVELGLKKAMVPGYRVAGKSGTAEIVEQESYQSRDIIASFVGFGPVPNPRFVVLVKYDKPREGYWGEEVAAPAFSRMMKFLFDYYGVSPSGR